MGRFDLITIARQFGAGGTELAAALGRRLGWPVFDHELVRAAAAQLHVEAEECASRDEYVASLLERLGASFTLGTPDLGPPTAMAAFEVDPDHLARAEHAVLRAAASLPPAILVGHGAQCLFHQRPRSLHVRLVAPLDARAARVAARQSMTLDAAREETRQRDREREKYLRHHFGCAPDDPMLYGLQINTSVVFLAEGEELVMSLLGSPSKASSESLPEPRPHAPPRAAAHG